MVDGLAERIRQGLRGLERHLLPNQCLLCAGPGDDGRDLCHGCDGDLPWLRHACPRCANPVPAALPDGAACGRCQRGETPTGFDAVRAPLLYDFPVDRLVLGLKFHGALAHARLLGELMARTAQQHRWPRPDGLLPVPLHRARWRERGFNQARELARPVAAKLQLPLLDGLATRRPARPQAELPLDRRRRNVRGRFRIEHTPPAHVTIVDDVVTSASTAAELARSLKHAGAERVEVWAATRTP